MITLKQVNKEIAKEYKDTTLVKGAGYYYLISQDNKINGKSIYVHHLNQLTLNQWTGEVKRVIEKR